MIPTYFDRIEDKYIISDVQYHNFTNFLSQYGKRDDYGNYPISSIYFDNDKAQLANESILYPNDNRKLRLRQYSHEAFNEKQSVMFELKERINNRIRKSRITLSFADFLTLIQDNGTSQISNATLSILLNLKNSLQLNPQLLIQYYREAFYFDNAPDLRITFDTNISCFLMNSLKGRPSNPRFSLLPENQYLMEIKYDHERPLWLTFFLDKNQIHKIEYSKYLSSYRLLFSQISG